MLESVKIIQISVATNNSGNVEIYGLDDDGNLYIKRGVRWGCVAVNQYSKDEKKKVEDKLYSKKEKEGFGEQVEKDKKKYGIY